MQQATLAVITAEIPAGITAMGAAALPAPETSKRRDQTHPHCLRAMPQQQQQQQQQQQMTLRTASLITAPPASTAAAAASLLQQTHDM